MADNTRGVQESKRLEGLIQELAEQVRQQALSNAAEIADIKQSLATKTYPTIGDETSPLNGEALSRSEGRREAGVGYSPYAAPTRQTKVDFPRFAGENLRGWLYKCEKNFELDGTPWDMKVKVAAVHLEGRALQWHQMYMQKRATRDTPLWDEYVQALHIRFGTMVFEDPMAKLMTLRQTGDLEECLEAFDLLLGRVCLPEEYAIGCLLAAIRGDIADVVRMHRPKTLLETYALARQRNINLKNSRGRNYTFVGSVPRVAGTQHRPPSYSNEAPKSSALPGLLQTPKPQVATYNGDKRNIHTSRRLSSAEMDEKRRRGICFWCDDKFTVGHKCRTRQIHMVTIDLLGEVPEEENTQEIYEPPVGKGREEDEPDDHPHLSLCALTGDVQEICCNTMRVIGKVKRGTINIFVDSGSTHNFLDVHTAKRMGFETELITPIFVPVASGERLVCREVCRNFPWSVQDHDFNTDVFLLKLGGCDMVLGVEWLATLGDITWNFQEFTMKFTYDGQEYSFQGAKESEQEEVEVHSLEKLLQRSSHSSTQLVKYLVFTQFIPDITLNALQLPAIDDEVEKEGVQWLLLKFQDVFLEPNALPPHRFVIIEFR